MQEIVRVLCGSHLYGTTVPGSDKDHKSIFMPEGRDILLGRVKNECKREGGDDAEFMSFQQFLKLLCQGQTNALDMLFAPEEFHVGKPGNAWYSVIANQERFISKNSEAFVGYCRQQAGKYAVKLDRYEAVKRAVEFFGRIPNDLGTKVGQVGAEALERLVNSSEHIEWVMKETAHGAQLSHLSVCQTMVPVTANCKLALNTFSRKLDSYGKRVQAAANMGEDDWKSMYHAVRVAYEAIELLETGRITLPRPERNLLRAIRLGKIPFDKVSAMIEENLVQVEQAVQASDLPEQPDWEFADGLVACFYRSAVCR
jgi:hypothetical protein